MLFTLVNAGSCSRTFVRSSVFLAGLASMQLAVEDRARAAPLPGTFAGGASTLSVAAAAGAVDLQIHNGAHEGCPCRGTHGNARTRTVSNLTLGSTVIATTAKVTATGAKSASSADVAETSQIENLDLFGGLITAKLLKAAASVTATPDTMQTSDEGTQFLDLVIAGNPVSADVADNTVIALPGIGTVTVRATKVVDGKTRARIAVEMLVIDVNTANSLGLPIGARLVLGRASAGYDRVQPAALLSGGAFGTRVKVAAGMVLQDAAGLGAGVGLPGCAGTDGKMLTKSVANVDVPGIVSVGLETETATGGPVGGSEMARTTSTFTNVRLLGGLISAEGLYAVAQASRTGETTTTSTMGTSVTNLAILGVPVTLSPAPNTRLDVPGVGYLIANEQVTHKTSVSVNALHLYVNTINLLGLPVGAEIILAHASAGAEKA